MASHYSSSTKKVYVVPTRSFFLSFSRRSSFFFPLSFRSSYPFRPLLSPLSVSPSAFLGVTEGNTKGIVAPLTSIDYHSHNSSTSSIAPLLVAHEHPLLCLFNPPHHLSCRKRSLIPRASPVSFLSLSLFCSFSFSTLPHSFFKILLSPRFTSSRAYLSLHRSKIVLCILHYRFVSLRYR